MSSNTAANRGTNKGANSDANSGTNSSPNSSGPKSSGPNSNAARKICLGCNRPSKVCLCDDLPKHKLRITVNGEVRSEVEDDQPELQAQRGSHAFQDQRGSKDEKPGSRDEQPGSQDHRTPLKIIVLQHPLEKKQKHQSLFFLERSLVDFHVVVGRSLRGNNRVRVLEHDRNNVGSLNSDRGDSHIAGNTAGSNIAGGNDGNNVGAHKSVGGGGSNSNSSGSGASSNNSATSGSTVESDNLKIEIQPKKTLLLFPSEGAKTVREIMCERGQSNSAVTSPSPRNEPITAPEQVQSDQSPPEQGQSDHNTPPSSTPNRNSESGIGVRLTTSATFDSLIVIDATWKFAKEMISNCEVLQKLQPVVFENIRGRKPEFVIRKPEKIGDVQGLSTAEAVAVFLEEWVYYNFRRTVTALGRMSSVERTSADGKDGKASSSSQLEPNGPDVYETIVRPLRTYVGYQMHFFKNVKTEASAAAGEGSQTGAAPGPGGTTGSTVQGSQLGAKGKKGVQEKGALPANPDRSGSAQQNRRRDHESRDFDPDLYSRTQAKRPKMEG